MGEIRIRVQPRSSRVGIEVMSDGSLRVKVMAAPVDGQANDALEELLSKALGVPKSSVSVIKGRRSRDKVIAIPGDADEAISKLKECGF